VVDSTTTVGASAICVSTGPWRRALGGAALRQGAPRGSVGLGGRVELGRDLGAAAPRCRAAPAARRSRRAAVALGLQLDAGELGEAPQAARGCTRPALAEVEDALQAGAGLLRIVRGADDLDDLVDVEDRDEKTLDEVQALLAAGEAVAAAPRDDLEAVPT
jgi:hypothetical protein